MASHAAAGKPRGTLHGPLKPSPLPNPRPKLHRRPLTEAEARAVLDDGAARRAQAVEQERAVRGAVVGGDQAERVERAALRVGRAAGAVAGQVGREQRLACGPGGVGVRGGGWMSGRVA
jgi:hypothetical protein